MARRRSGIAGCLRFAPRLFVSFAPPRDIHEPILRPRLSSRGGRWGSSSPAGYRKFLHNDVAGSLADFDRAAELDPKLAPQLWQRAGISDYYVGKCREGRRQFELHQTVNPHDVENAAWHFLCVVRLDGLEAAQKSLLKVDKARDTRVPMPEIYEMLGGHGSTESTCCRPPRSEAAPQAAMYANLYVWDFLTRRRATKASRRSLTFAKRLPLPRCTPPASCAMWRKVHLRASGTSGPVSIVLRARCIRIGRERQAARRDCPSHEAQMIKLAKNWNPALPSVNSRGRGRSSRVVGPAPPFQIEQACSGPSCPNDKRSDQFCTMISGNVVSNWACPSLRL